MNLTRYDLTKSVSHFLTRKIYLNKMRKLKCRTLGHSLENYSFKFLLISDFDVADESSVCIVGREGEKKGL